MNHDFIFTNLTVAEGGYILTYTCQNKDCKLSYQTHTTTPPDVVDTVDVGAIERVLAFIERDYMECHYDPLLDMRIKSRDLAVNNVLGAPDS